jgi:hypothetical protein
VYQTEVALIAGAPMALGQETMSPVPLAQVVRKGETMARLAQGPAVAGMLHGPLGQGWSAMVGAQAGWSFELPFLTLLPRVGISRGHASQLAGAVSQHTMDEISVELGALHVFDLGALSIAPLVSVGPAFLSQTVLATGCAQGAATCRFDSHPVALVTTLGAWASWSLGRGFLLEATAELANFYVRRQLKSDDLDPQAAVSGTLTYRASLGLGYRY